MRARVWIGAAVLILAGGGCPADDDLPPDTGDDGEGETAVDDRTAEVDGGAADDGPTEADAAACTPSDNLACMQSCAAPMWTPNGGVCVDGECRCDLCDDSTCYVYCSGGGGRNTSRCYGDRCQCSHEDPPWDAEAGADDADVGIADEGAADADAGVE
ncbi:MAG: hypothetical protein HY907_10395 [Deltaproteobacteria bacterium]|nr:hypothetical protein [Deltaproteobacteria bacterium]